MLYSIIAILVACSGGQKEETQTPTTATVPEVAPTEVVAEPVCTDPTPEDGVDECSDSQVVVPATESTATDRPIVVLGN